VALIIQTLLLEFSSANSSLLLPIKLGFELGFKLGFGLGFDLCSNRVLLVARISWARLSGPLPCPLLQARPWSLFMRKGADVLSKWVGEVERQLRLLFEEAERQLRLLFEEAERQLRLLFEAAERQLRLLFEEAQRNAPAIIFFDEIDGLAPVGRSRGAHACLPSAWLGWLAGAAALHAPCMHITRTPYLSQRSSHPALPTT
jgi:hypothetical protein